MQLPWALLPALLLKAGASAARSTDAALRRAFERSLEHRTSHYTPAAADSGLDRSRRHYTGTATVSATLGDVLERFEEFAIEELHGWRKVSAFVDANGRAEAVFSGQFTFAVRLAPRSALSRMREGFEAYNGASFRSTTNVPYRYIVRFSFEASGDCVHVAHSTTETVAPYGLLDRDVSHHYSAPTLPRGIGAVGDRFIDVVRSFAERSS